MMKHRIALFFLSFLNFIVFSESYPVISRGRPKIAGYQLDGYIMNAAGCHDHTFSELQDLAQSDTAAIVSKSCSFYPQPGNRGAIYWQGTDRSINSIGLRDKGCAFYIKCLDELAQRGCAKPQFISLAAGQDGFDKALVLLVSHNDTAGNTPIILELNVSCPNAGGSMLGYRFDDFDKAISHVSVMYKKSFGIKLPPYLDISQFERVVEIIQKHSLVQFITCTNSVRGLVFDFERSAQGELKRRTAIDPNSGIGGISGPIIKPVGLANVMTFRQLFNERNMDVAIIGCGGIAEAKDVVEYLASGANAVQVGFQLKKEGPDVFARLNREVSFLLGEQSVAEHIYSLLQTAAHQEYFGEDVTELEHALQCAHFARADGANTEMVLAALLHDIGHFCDVNVGSDFAGGLGKAGHEKIGAQFLKQCGASERMCALAEGHVDAKRYLVFKNPEYRKKLSEASKQTLIQQGGPMSEEEAARFERGPYFKDILRLRSYDERGKVPGLKVDSLEYYKSLLFSYFEKRATADRSDS